MTAIFHLYDKYIINRLHYILKKNYINVQKMNNILEQISVDIILPNYNSSSYIEETLVSVINQRFKNWKLFIVDDNSDNKTKDILIKKEFATILSNFSLVSSKVTSSSPDSTLASPR